MKAKLILEMPKTCNMCPCLWNPEYNKTGYCQALTFINTSSMNEYPTVYRSVRNDCPLIPIEE